MRRPTEPKPVTGPILSKELHAVRQELRLQTLIIVGGVLAILFFGAGGLK